MTPDLHVLAIGGSLRAGSYNGRLLREAAALAPDGVRVELWEGLRGIPPFDEDYEDTPPEPVRRMNERIAGAGALLIATPEYNHSLPGQLKNALDWASRPFDVASLRGRPAAVLSASTGRFGAIWAQQELRKVLRASGARVLETGLAVPAAHDAFTPEGRLRSGELRERLTEILAELRAEAAPASEAERSSPVAAPA